MSNLKTSLKKLVTFLISKQIKTYYLHYNYNGILKKVTTSKSTFTTDESLHKSLYLITSSIIYK